MHVMSSVLIKTWLLYLFILNYRSRLESQEIEHSMYKCNFRGD